LEPERTQESARREQAPVAIIAECLAKGDIGRAKGLLEQMPPADVADVLAALDQDQPVKAVSAGPFITMLKDVMCIFIYLMLGTMVVSRL